MSSLLVDVELDALAEHVDVGLPVLELLAVELVERRERRASVGSSSSTAVRLDRLRRILELGLVELGDLVEDLLPLARARSTSSRFFS